MSDDGSASTSYDVDETSALLGAPRTTHKLGSVIASSASRSKDRTETGHFYDATTTQAQDRVVISPVEDEVDEIEVGRSDSFRGRTESLLLSSERLMLRDGVSNLETFMHLLKGNIGTGILTLPLALKHSGLWTGFFGILFIGSISLHCMHVLVKCSHILCRRTGNTALDYPDVMEVCLKTGPQKFRRAAKGARFFVEALLVFTQIGFVCVYIGFIGSNIAAFLTNFTDALDDQICMLLTTIALIPYVCVRDLRVLSPFSAFANVVVFTGLIIIFQYIVRDTHDVSVLPAFSSFKELPLFFGTAMFAIEGISLVLPLENNMRNPRDFGGFAGVLNLGMVTVVCMFAGMGFYGYLKFGDNILKSITLNLPPTDWLYSSVKLMFCFGCYISYNLQFYVPINILWPSIKNRLKWSSARKYGEFPFRIFLLFFSYAFAAGVPNYDLLIALIGAFASTSLALLFPVFIEIITWYGTDKPVPVYIWLKNTFIVLLGLLGFFTGTYSALVEIITAFG